MSTHPVLARVPRAKSQVQKTILKRRPLSLHPSASQSVSLMRSVNKEIGKAPVQSNVSDSVTSCLRPRMQVIGMAPKVTPTLQGLGSLTKKVNLRMDAVLRADRSKLSICETLAVRAPTEEDYAARLRALEIFCTKEGIKLNFQDKDSVTIALLEYFDHLL
eukprot:4441804-Karenia_brevis.AAC.1